MSDTALRHLRMLSRYTAWANTRLFDALVALPPAESTARRNHGQHSMVGMLAHAWVVDRIWQAHLQGRAHGYSSRQPEAEPALAQLKKDQAELDRWYVAYADGLDAAAEAEVVDFRFVDGGAGTMRRGDMLLHVINHKTYHRGYVADMLYQAGSRPPVMDLPVFLRDVPQV
ncbi:MAG: DinB family protein [Hylemonella sp.]|nr:DinB family protein [Hylemonella sp.]